MQIRNVYSAGILPIPFSNLGFLASHRDVPHLPGNIGLVIYSQLSTSCPELERAQRLSLDSGQTIWLGEH